MPQKVKNSEALLAAIRNGRHLDSRSQLSLIISLSIPSILAQITSVMMFFIDQAMVGRIGVEAAAACGLVESSMWLCVSMTGAATMGFSVQVAHFIGSNDFTKARQVFRHGIICTLLLSLCIALTGLFISPDLPYWLRGKADIAHEATTYFAIFMLAIPFFQLNNLSSSMLKCSGNMRIPSIMSIIMCVTDVVLNFIFIFIFHMGVLGVAIGTSLAVVIGGCVQAYFAIFRSHMLALNREGEHFHWNPAYIKNALKISIPMAIQNVLMSGAQIVSTVIVAPIGNIAIAANTFAITAESLCYMPGYGIGEAATTLVGQTKGAGRIALCRAFAWKTVALGMTVMAIMGCIMFATAPQLMGLMTPVATIRDLGASVLRIEAFAEPMFAASIVVYSICVGAGDTLKPALINLISMWCVRLTMAAWLSRDYGLQGVWTAMAIELTFRGTLFLIRLARGRWLNNKIKG